MFKLRYIPNKGCHPTRLSRRQLLALAATIGADVPFFVSGDNAFVEGTGERITPLALPAQRFAVVKPAAGLGTAQVFARAKLAASGHDAILAGSLTDAQLLARFCDGYGRNQLQPAAQDECPEVQAVATWLNGRYGNSRMTGSGSAVFARVGADDPPLATTLQDTVPAGWVARMCRSLDHHPLRGWAG
jgi:4-diphosphocytidyl-2-C-methyl-D-erythritol kinase